jgi:hypothetical protein
MAERGGYRGSYRQAHFVKLVSLANDKKGARTFSGSFDSCGLKNDEIGVDKPCPPLQSLQ